MVQHNNMIKTFVSEKLSSCFSLISMKFFFGIWRMFTEASGEHPLMILLSSDRVVDKLSQQFPLSAQRRRKIKRIKEAKYQVLKNC